MAGNSNTDDQDLSSLFPSSSNLGIGSGMSGVTQSNNSQTSTNDTQSFNYIPNVLSQYSNFSYNLRLEVTLPQNFNLMVTQQSYDANLWTTIIQTPNVGKARAHRPPTMQNGQLQNNAGTTTYFNNDLYIDNLDIQTWCGLTNLTRSGNIGEITFRITEPYGMSFIEEMFDFCHNANGLGEKNYLQLPFMIIIEFNGYLDDGTWQKIPAATKYIPISILNVTTKLNVSGAEYTVTACPYHELALSEKYGRLFDQIEVSGKTINDMISELAVKVNQDQEAAKKQLKYDYADVYSFIVVNQTSSEISTGQIQIGNVVISHPTTIASKDSPMLIASGSGKSVDYTVKAKNMLSYKGTTQSQGIGATIGNGSTIRFSSGSSVVACLSNLIIGSNYTTQQTIDYQKKFDQINQQLNNSSSAGNASASSGSTQLFQSLEYPLQWFKVVTQITLGPYDTIRNVYSKNITFTIKPYLVDNAKSAYTPGQTPNLRVLKNYQYLFTGKNSEVINFEIDFNAAYQTYSQVNSNTKALATGETNPTNNPNSMQINVVSTQNYVNQGLSSLAVPYSPNTTMGVGSISIGRSLASDIASSLYAKYELLEINLSIFGDPDYIKQDEIFLNPPDNLNPYITPNNGTTGSSSPGGIAFDAGEIYFNLQFKVPIDYNQNTGIMDFSNLSSTQIDRTSFSGLYSVLEIQNSFSGGKFTQSLHCKRFDDSNKLQVVTPTVTPVQDTTPDVEDDGS